MNMMLFILLACQDRTSENKVEKTVDNSAKVETQTAVKTDTKAKMKVEPKTEATMPAKDTVDMAKLDPKYAIKKAPDDFDVLFETTKGKVVIEVKREWSPLGADRFYNLVEMGYFTDVAFFRAIKGFMNQFGIHGDPKVALMWKNAKIKDDQVLQSNTRGFVSFATSGKNSRTTQMFINTKDNGNLDGMGFSPFGKVSESKGGGMKVVDQLFTGYGEGAPRGRGPSQGRIQMQGNQYLKSSFPNLDYILSSRICNNDCE